MKLILFSPPKRDPDEFLLTNKMLAEGVFMYHLHKPDYTFVEYETAFLQIEPKFRKFVVLHQHHGVANKFAVGGLYFSRNLQQNLSAAKLNEKLKNVRKKGSFVCCGLHSLADLEIKNTIFDYVLLSPVFNSISKSKYTPKFSLEAVKSIIQKHKFGNIAALGGVNKNHVIFLKEIGFFAVAVLGAIWQREQPLKEFFEIKNRIAS